MSIKLNKSLLFIHHYWGKGRFSKIVTYRHSTSYCTCACHSFSFGCTWFRTWTRWSRAVTSPFVRSDTSWWQSADRCHSGPRGTAAHTCGCHRRALCRRCHRTARSQRCTASGTGTCRKDTTAASSEDMRHIPGDDTPAHICDYLSDLEFLWMNYFRIIFFYFFF